MILLLLGLSLPFVGGVCSLLLSRQPLAATWAGASSAVAGAALGLAGAFVALSGTGIPDIRLAWHVPYGEFHVGVDALSAVFLVIIFGLGLVAALYGAPYLLHYRKTKSLGAPWFFFNLLLSSMVLLVISRNGMLFLVSWEVMAVASFFLVTFEHEKVEVRNAGWTYLIMSHIGTAFLLAFFAIIGHESGSLDFDSFGVLKGVAPATASGLFLLALTGFGAKAGFIPLHVWLPEAHPAAPSHVSAIMSGVMIKTGIYGILRTLVFLGPPPAWWGVTLIVIGVVSGILGVLFALAQRDVKRMLAYCSVENVGIVALGLGVGIWGLSQGSEIVALFGFAGAILHIMNHAIFKGLLFFGAGSVLHSTGERDMDRLGGMMRKLPVTGATFLVASAAISGLPPFAGFVSEFLIMSGSLRGVLLQGSQSTAALIAVIAGLGLIGGLAVACFSKAFGVIFLGKPRNGHSEHAHREVPGFRLPMIALATACIFIGLVPVLAVRLVLPAATQLAGGVSGDALLQLTSSSGVLGRVSLISIILMGVVVVLVLLRWLLLRNRQVRVAPTWGCGFESPNSRMQYTSSSFAQPILSIFRQLVRSRQHVHGPEGYFPRKAGFRSETPDIFGARLYRPLQSAIERIAFKLRWLQHGRVHLYLLYIFVTLLILMVWRLRF